MIEYENLAKLNKPFFIEYKNAFEKFLNSGFYVASENVTKFEEEFSDFVGADFCVGLSSGLDALRLALRALKLEKGSEIIAPSNTYIATLLPIVEFNYKMVLVEPDINTYNIDPKEIERKITNKTKAIVVTHLYGKACDMDPIMNLARKYNLKVVEDCAQAHGAKYNGKIVGTFGDIGCFSFYPTKNLGALGEAGCIVTNNINYANIVKSLRNYGSLKKDYYEIMGYNCRMDESQASFLRIKLKSLDDITEHKRKLADIYNKKITNSKIIKPSLKENFFDVYHIYNIRSNERDKLKKYLEKNQIMTKIHYPISPNNQKAFSHLNLKHFPISEKIHETTLSLPISYFHTGEDIQQVIKILNDF